MLWKSSHVKFLVMIKKFDVEKLMEFGLKFDKKLK